MAFAEDIFDGSIGKVITVERLGRGSAGHADCEIITGVLVDVDGDTLMIHAGGGSGYPVHGCLPGDVCMVEIDATDVCGAFTRK